MVVTGRGDPAFERARLKAISQGRKGFRYKGLFFPLRISARQAGIRTALKRKQFSIEEARALGFSEGDIQAALTGDRSLRESELRARSKTVEGQRKALELTAASGGREALGLAAFSRSLESKQAQQGVKVVAAAEKLIKNTRVGGTTMPISTQPEVQNAFPVSAIVGGLRAAAGTTIGRTVIGTAAGALVGAGVTAGIAAFSGRGRRVRRGTNIITKRGMKQIRRIGKFRKQVAKAASELGYTLKRRGAPRVSAGSKGIITSRELVEALRR